MEKIVYKQIGRRAGWGYAYIDYNPFRGGSVYGVGRTQREAYKNACETIKKSGNPIMKRFLKVVRITPMALEICQKLGYHRDYIDVTTFGDLTTASVLRSFDDRGKHYWTFDQVVDIKSGYEEKVSKWLEIVKSKKEAAVI